MEKSTENPEMFEYPNTNSPEVAEWRFGLCGCFSNCGLSMLTMVCPCLVFGNVAEAVGDRCCTSGLCFLIPIANVIAFADIRGKVRSSLSIQGSSRDDILMGLFCMFCGTVQMAAEAMEVLDGNIERE